MIGIQSYVVMPLCIDQNGHHFTIPTSSSKAVCSRCGLIREQPSGPASVVPGIVTIGPRCCYCGHGVANPGDECGMCAGSKAAQQRRGAVAE